MPAKIVEAGVVNSSADYVLMEVDASGNAVTSGNVVISGTEITAKKAGSAYVMVSYELDGETYTSRIVKINVVKPVVKYNGAIEIDLKGESTFDISSIKSKLDISEPLTGVQIAGETPVNCTVSGTNVTGLVGREKCDLIFATETYEVQAQATIYTLKISSYADLANMSKTINANKVSNGNGGYVSDGYYVLTSDIEPANGAEQNDFEPWFFITLTDANSGFKGTFDGQGYTIKGIRVYSQRDGNNNRFNEPGLYARGLFSNLVEGGVIKNVTVTAGTIDATNAIFGYNSKGTLENVRVHIDNAIYNGEQAPLFDHVILGGSIKNVFVTFGDGITFAGNTNGLISSKIEPGVTIRGLYVVGSYVSAQNTNPMVTWTKSKTTFDARYIGAMTEDGVKYGAYFASAQDFADGIETIEGEKQAANTDYKEQIALLYDSTVWNLNGTYPELVKGVSSSDKPLVSVQWQKAVSEINICTSDTFGADTQKNMPAIVYVNGIINSSAKYSIIEVDADGNPVATSGFVRITNDDIEALATGTTYIMAIYEDGGETYASRVIKVNVTRPASKYNGTIEIDLNGAKTIDVTSVLSTLSITEQLTGVQIKGDTLIDCTVSGNNVTGLVGSEKCTLIFKTAGYDLEVEAKIYTLKIDSVADLNQMGTILNANKVSNGNGGYVVGGYFVLTDDIVTTTSTDVTPGLYIANNDFNSGFNGTFDGQGYSIATINVYSRRTGSGDNAGLYAWGMFSNLLSGGVIKNVSITAGTGNDGTKALFGVCSKGTLENVRIHIEKATYNGEQAPLFDNALLSGALKNVFVTFGGAVTFAGNSNGLISSKIEPGVTIEGLYVVGSYTSTSNTNAMVTWTKNKSTYDARYIAAMTKNGVKYGAYFDSVIDFIDGIETIEGVKQTATDVYEKQIAQLYDSEIWDLTSGLPTLKSASK